MVSLIAKTPCDGLLPVTIGDMTLTEVLPGAITSVAPFDGRLDDVSGQMKDTFGAPFPAPGRATGKEGARAVWAGRGRALVLGPAIAPSGAAVTDQSDGWAVLRLAGAGAGAALARLVPVDLRAQVFRRGHSAQTLLSHMSCAITRVGADRFELMVFRSMAATAVHELTGAMHSVAAQADIPHL